VVLQQISGDTDAYSANAALPKLEAMLPHVSENARQGGGGLPIKYCVRRERERDQIPECVQSFGSHGAHARHDDF
jgi:hypothetical protein